MDYEQKYKEVQKWIESIYPDLSHEQQMEAEAFFPELSESEDEKVRKALIELVKYAKGHCWELLDKPFNIVPMDAMLAWLEKQGKQILANSEKTCKDEKKSVIDIEIPFGAKDSELQEATYLIPEGFHAEIKDNEVLIKKGKQKPAELHKEDEQNLNACLGYIPDEFLRRWLTDIIHVKYNKVVWSEEDRDYYDAIIAKLEVTQDDAALTDNQMEFLKSLKNRIKGE